MTDSMLFEFLWLASAILAILSLVLLAGLALKRSLAPRRRARKDEDNRRAFQAVIGWIDGGDQNADFQDLSRARRKAAIDTAVNMLQVVRGEARGQILDLVERLDGISALVKEARSPRKDRRLNAVCLLRYFRSPEAIAALRLRLDDPVMAIRVEAEIALRMAGEPRTVEHTINNLALPGRTLQLYDYKLFRLIAESDLQELAALGKTSVCANVRALCAHGLGASPDFSMIFTLLKMAGDPDPAVRTEVAAALGNLQHPHAQSVLVTAARDQAWQVRAAAVRSIAQIGLDQTCLLAALSQNDENWRVRLEAEEALKKLEAGHEKVTQESASQELGTLTIVSMQGEIR